MAPYPVGELLQFQLVQDIKLSAKVRILLWVNSFKIRLVLNPQVPLQTSKGAQDC